MTNCNGVILLVLNFISVLIRTVMSKCEYCNLSQCAEYCFMTIHYEHEPPLKRTGCIDRMMLEMNFGAEGRDKLQHHTHSPFCHFTEQPVKMMMCACSREWTEQQTIRKHSYNATLALDYLNSLDKTNEQEKQQIVNKLRTVQPPNHVKVIDRKSDVLSLKASQTTERDIDWTTTVMPQTRKQAQVLTRLSLYGHLTKEEHEERIKTRRLDRFQSVYHEQRKLNAGAVLNCDLQLLIMSFLLILSTTHMFCLPN